jgi:hypothetical protein
MASDDGSAFLLLDNMSLLSFHSKGLPIEEQRKSCEELLRKGGNPCPTEVQNESSQERFS